MAVVLAPEKPKKTHLYLAGAPAPQFNKLVLSWLKGELEVYEHAPPRAFDGLRKAYDDLRGELVAKGASKLDSHKKVLSTLTDLMLGTDLRTKLLELLGDRAYDGGFRSALAQGLAKNVGENFTNAIVYGLADLLCDQDEVLVDKGLCAPVKPLVRIQRPIALSHQNENLDVLIEVDFAIWRRDAPDDAIVGSAKTRLKEIFHIGTMWKLFFDMIDDPAAKQKWGLVAAGPTTNMDYVFATADLIGGKAERSQGPDISDSGVRNMIKFDASFFDYVFVSKSGTQMSSTLDLAAGRETLFHELGCLVDLTAQKFALAL